jgi:chemotaxis protein MotA
MQYHEMVVDGISMIADGENPRAIQTRLEGYID